MNNLKKLIYEHFDRHGITGKFMAKIRLSFASNEENYSQSYKKVFIPQLNQFTLSEKEINQVIIDYIFDTTSYDIKSVNNLDKFSSINGLPFLLCLNEASEEKTFSLAFGKIPGSVTIRSNHNIESLGNIEEINGDLGLIGSSIGSLGKLKKVSGSFWIAQFSPYTNITDLNELEYVGGDLYLKNSPIRDLKNLKKVGGTLNLRSTRIESLGLLNSVRKNIYLPKELKDKFNLSDIFIGGKVKYFSK